jgi:DNA-binding MarR family transcriptional regulator
METGNETANKLMQAFIQLHRLKMNHGMVGGMKHSEARVLRSIHKMDSGQGVMVSELSGRLKVSAPSITQTVNSLVEQGLVNRMVDPSDRRAVRLRITPYGKEVLDRVYQEFMAIHSGLVEYLGEEQSAVLTDLLQKVYQYFEIAGGRQHD